MKKLWSHKEDVTLANPWGPPVRGFDEVAKTIEHAASLRRDGEFVGSEIVAKYVTAELAYVVQLERAKAKVGEGGLRFHGRSELSCRFVKGVIGQERQALLAELRRKPLGWFAPRGAL